MVRTANNSSSKQRIQLHVGMYVAGCICVRYDCTHVLITIFCCVGHQDAFEMDRLQEANLKRGYLVGPRSEDEMVRESPRFLRRATCLSFVVYIAF